MHSSSRFAVAVHTLVYLAMGKAFDTVTSEMIAKSVNTNPVVIRRVLGSLRKAGLVNSQSGNKGGWTLVRPAKAITLRDIYRLVEPDTVFALPQRAGNPLCPVGKNMQRILDGYFRDAERAMEERLARVTLADVIANVSAQAQKSMAHAEDLERRRRHMRSTGKRATRR